MTDSGERCSEGWDPAELLAYLEGDLKPDEVRRLEEHLRTCKACSVEFESLRRLDLLLKRNPESFHPDKDELYRFASAGEDTRSPLATHIHSCPTCKEDVKILREMISLRASGDAEAVTLPPALAEEFQRIHGMKGHAEIPEGRLRALWRRLLEIPNSLPVLTLGTAAAVLIIAVFAVPLWKSYVEPPLPQTTALPSASAPRPAEPQIAVQQAAPEEARAVLGSSQEPAKHKKLEEYEPGQYLADRNMQVQGKRDVRQSKQSPSVDGAPAREAPATRGETLKENAPLPAPATVAPRKRPFASSRPESAPSDKLESREEHEKLPRKGEVKRKQEAGEKALSAKPVAGLADTATAPPIEVRIVDDQGRDLPGVTFVLPTDRRFAFNRGGAEDEKDRAAAKPAPEISRDREVSSRIIIKVTAGQGADYNLEGQLFHGDSAVAEKTLRMEKVPKDNLTRSIQDLAASLVDDRADGR